MTKKQNEQNENKTVNEQVADAVVKRGRGRPKGTGGNKRPDMSRTANQNLKPGDNSKYIREAIEKWNLPALDLNDPKQVEERVLWYFNRCAENDSKPLVSGLCSALGISTETFRRWGTGERRENSDHGVLVKKAHAVMMEIWEAYGNNGKINPVVWIYLGKNFFGMRDQQEVIITPHDPLGEETDEARLADKYAESVIVDVDDFEDKTGQNE